MCLVEHDGFVSEWFGLAFAKNFLRLNSVAEQQSPHIAFGDEGVTDVLANGWREVG